MDRKAVDALGEGAFSVTLIPLKRSRAYSYPVLGFDTEYTSKGGELISIQLHNGKRGNFVPMRKLSVDRLAREARRLIGPEAVEVTLVAYFSIAELQHLPVVDESIEVRSWGASLDVAFYSERWSLVIRVFDLARFFDRVGLAKVAKSFGLEKLEEDTTNVTKASINRKRFRTYALHDAFLCAEIARLLRAGFSKDGVDPLREGSPASTAACLFRHTYLRKEVAPPASRIRLISLLSCWGGRAEAVVRGKFRRVWEYDLRGAYPAAAISLGILPSGKDWKNLTPRKILTCVGGMARVRFRFPPDEMYPCLPVWTKTGMIYPLRGESWTTVDEIRAALSMDAKISIVEGYCFSAGVTYLADYMKAVVAERKKTKDPVRRVALKLLANSLIGKLAQRVTDIDVQSLIEFARLKGAGFNELLSLTREEAAALGIKSIVKLGTLFMPEWNGLITGRVRAKIGIAARETEALYISTDCVWTGQSPGKITLGSEFEHKRKGPAIVARTRFAMLGNYVAHHSIWQRAAGKEILEAFDDEDIEYTIRRPIKLRESLLRGKRYGQWVEEKRKGNARWDFKRKLIGNQGRTAPWNRAADYIEAKAVDAKTRRRNKGLSKSGNS